jgi:Zn-dependent peptidase ImmA (M78 family)/DNA-binding XRE family transcriptional regulator
MDGGFMTEEEYKGVSPTDLGKRLQTLRRLRNRTQMDIAKSLGLSRPSVAAIEAGQRRVDSQLLVELARAYGARLSELVREPSPPATLQAQFRLPAAASKTEREELEQAVVSLQMMASAYLQLERLLDSPLRASPVPRYSYEVRRLEQDAEGVAEAERRRLGIGDGPVLRLRELLEREAGARVFHIGLPGGIAALYGFSAEAGPCVAVNSKHALVRQRWSLAHEFGHVLTRLDRPEVTTVSGYQRTPEPERFAEHFAGAFLMPSSGLERRLRGLESGDRHITVGDLLLMADEYEVSLQAMVLRLEGIRVLPPATWDRLTHKGVSIRAASELLGIRAGASDTLQFPRRFIYLALEAYDRELLTERELANLLGQDRLTVRAIVDRLSNRSRDLTAEPAWDIRLSESLPLGISN